MKLQANRIKCSSSIKKKLKTIGLYVPWLVQGLLKIYRNSQELVIPQVDLVEIESEISSFEVQRDSNTDRCEKINHVYVDVTNLSLDDKKTGIQRVCKAIVSHGKELLNNNENWELVPVYSELNSAFYFRCYLEEDSSIARSERLYKNSVQIGKNDILLLPDENFLDIYIKLSQLKGYIENGTRIYAILYDLIPTEYPDFYSNEIRDMYDLYLKAVSELSGVIAISKATLTSYKNWLTNKNISVSENYLFKYNHLGCDFINLNNTYSLTSKDKKVVNKLKKKETFLVVGTLEPRKMHTQIYEAFTLLWKAGYDINLVFVGKYGWRMEKEASRFVWSKERGRHFFWIQGASDALLNNIYAESCAVIQASLQEGFGLPLIEAFMHGKKLIIRDIPVFREIAGDNATYFTGDRASELAAVIKQWLIDDKCNNSLLPDEMVYLTWSESVTKLFELMGIM